MLGYLQLVLVTLHGRIAMSIEQEN
jgi:hypothetical protein